MVRLLQRRRLNRTKSNKIMAQFEKGKVFNASESIDYAEGGIVSKELVHSRAGSVTLFAFDEGQGLSEHTAPFDALIQVIDGELALTVDHEECLVKAGESYVIPSGAAHALHAGRRFKMMLTMIRG